MNERIRELMKQADYPAPEIALRAQKLALLMVKEYASIVDDAVDHREPASTYADKIREHFGVEL